MVALFIKNYGDYYAVELEILKQQCKYYKGINYLYTNPEFLCDDDKYSEMYCKFSKFFVSSELKPILYLRQ